MQTAKERKAFTMQVAHNAETMLATHYEKGRLQIAGEGTGFTRGFLKRDGVGYKLARAPGYRRFNIFEYTQYWKFCDSMRRHVITPYYMTQCGSVTAWELVTPWNLAAHYRLTDEMIYQSIKFNNVLIEGLMESGWREADAKDAMSDNHTGNFGLRDDDSLVWIDFAAPKLNGGLWEEPQMK